MNIKLIINTPTSSIESRISNISKLACQLREVQVCEESFINHWEYQTSWVRNSWVLSSTAPKSMITQIRSSKYHCIYTWLFMMSYTLHFFDEISKTTSCANFSSSVWTSTCGVRSGNIFGEKCTQIWARYPNGLGNKTGRARTGRGFIWTIMSFEKCFWSAMGVWRLDCVHVQSSTSIRLPEVQWC